VPRSTDTVPPDVWESKTFADRRTLGHAIPLHRWYEQRPHLDDDLHQRQNHTTNYTTRPWQTKLGRVSVKHSMWKRLPINVHLGHAGLIVNAESPDWIRLKNWNWNSKPRHVLQRDHRLFVTTNHSANYRMNSHCHMYRLSVEYSRHELYSFTRQPAQCKPFRLLRQFTGPPSCSDLASSISTTL